MNALAGFVERTDFWWRLKRTLLVFGVPIVGTAIVLVVATTIAHWLQPAPMSVETPAPPLPTAPVVPDRQPVAVPDHSDAPSPGPMVSGPPIRLRGTIAAASDGTLFVKTREGSEVRVRLTNDAQVNGVVRAALSDIKQNSFVGITAMPQPDGTQRAIEVHIFPEASRGTGEGHRPWDLMPNSTMTNASVEQLVTSVDGPTLTVKYKDGEKKFYVPNNIPIVKYVVGSQMDLKPGAKIFIAAGAKRNDGTIEAARITVGQDGITPPM
jgi:hypothetical protein